MLPPKKLPSFYVQALKAARDAANEAVQASLKVPDLDQQDEGAIWRHYQGLSTMYNLAKPLENSLEADEDLYKLNLNESHHDESPFSAFYAPEEYGSWGAAGPVSMPGSEGQDVITFS